MERSAMVVFREGVGHWWKSWDGARHYTDTLNFKHSLWTCFRDVGRFNQVGVVFLDCEAYGVQDNPASFRPTGDLDIEILSDGISQFNVIEWNKIPECLVGKVYGATGASKQLKRVEFDMNDADQFLAWVDVKMFGIGALSPEGN